MPKAGSSHRAIASEEVDRFFAAVHRFGATKGVLITSGRFTENARRAAKSARGATIRLIDGTELTDLMMRHCLGVRHEALPIPRLDLDFWEDE
jgi:restriction system protein